MKKLIFLLIVILATSSLWAQQKYALVIGNGNYTNITKLNNPVNDANDITVALQSLGFTVDKLLNASLDQMENAAIRLKNRLSASKNSYGFLFYAGHAVQSNGENYLLPVDANMQSESFLRQRAVSLQALLDELNDAENLLNVVVLDACRDNPFSWRRSGSRGLTVVGKLPVDSIIVFATGAGSTAADGTGRNGLFTGHLLNHLKTPGLEVTEVFRRTMGDVSRSSNNQQRPAVYNQFSGLAYLGSQPATIVQPAPTPQPVLQPVPTPQYAPITQPTPVLQPSSISANMIRINGGTFQMGSPANEVDRERNEVQHSVTVSSFYMGKYLVTQKEYREVMGTNPSKFKGDNFPVEQVSWFDAVNYCNRLSQREGLTPAYTINGENVTWNRNANGYRLPTEAEWEYACRAGTATPFSTGNNITTSQANYDGNYPYNNNAKGTYRGKTTTVGSFSPNTWGLYDMHGNICEWCWDWDGNYSSGTDPIGSVSGDYRVTRGGSWYNYGRSLRSAYRRSSKPSYKNDGIGFRLVRS
jgi:formylglycine-generating enzyme required for sulfatase activity